MTEKEMAQLVFIIACCINAVAILFKMPVTASISGVIMGYSLKLSGV